MKKLLILSIALLAAVACSVKETNEVEVVIETLEGSQFTLSQFGAYRFPATDSWVIEDQSASTDDFAALSAAIEYISNNYPERQISITFSSIEAIPAYAIYGVEVSDRARNFAALTSISAPYASSLGAYAFEYCTSLVSIEIPAVATLGGYALRGCSSLTAIDLPAATTIDYAAISECSSLKSASIPLAESIGDQAFRLCSALTTIELPATETLAYGAFAYCEALTSLSAPQLLSIGEYAFSECVSLNEIDMPLVEQISNYAFIACDGFESFTIPSNVNLLGNGVFNECESLTEIIVENDNFTFEDGVLYSSDKSEAIVALQAAVTGAITLPESVTSLRERAFYSCYNMTSITTSATSVGASAFANCTEITSAVLSAATSLEEEVFANCESMKSINAPYITTLAYKSLYNCESLVEISMATASGVALESLDTHVFQSTVITDIVVTVGAANADFVTYDDTLTVGDFEAEFSEIIVLEA